MEWVVAFLERTVEENADDSMAHCALAIMQFRAGEFENAKKSMDRSKSGDASLTRTTSGKFQLLLAINAEDGATATALFEALLGACQRQSTSFALRKSYCEWMGEIIGVLDSEEAQPPIDLELLSKAKKSLLGMAETKLSLAFENQYSLSRAKAEETQKTLQRYAELGEAGMQELDRSRSNELETLEELLLAAVKESRESSNEAQVAIKGYRQEMAGLREQFRSKELERANNAFPMPIPVNQPFGPPPIPIRDAIYVDPFYIRFVSENINNQSVTRQIQERRDFRDIENERNAIFQTQLSYYQTQLSSYNLQKSLFNQYQKDLAGWKLREDERRRKLTEEQRVLESQIAQIKTQIDALEGMKKDNAGGNIEIRNSIAQLKIEQTSVRKVLNAAKTGKPHLALRPMTIDPWLLTEEKNLLLKMASGKP